MGDQQPTVRSPRTYRLIHLNDKGHFMSVEVIETVDDSDAVTQGKEKIKRARHTDFLTVAA